MVKELFCFLCLLSFSEDVHAVPAPLPKSVPASTIPLLHPRPTLLWRNSFDPNQYSAECKIRIGKVPPGHHDSIAIFPAVFVQNRRKEVKVVTDGLPRLLALRAGGEHVGRPLPWGEKVCLATLGELLMAERHHYWEKRSRKHLLQVVHEERLKGAGSLGEDGTRRIRVLEIVGDGGWVGKDDGGSRGANGINNYGEGVYRSAVRTHRRGGSTDGAQCAFQIGEVDPRRAVRQSFIIQDESVKNVYALVRELIEYDKKYIPDTRYVRSPRVRRCRRCVV